MLTYEIRGVLFTYIYIFLQLNNSFFFIKINKFTVQYMSHYLLPFVKIITKHTLKKLGLKSLLFNFFRGF